MQAKSRLAVAFFGLGFAVSGASGAALVPPSSFVQPAYMDGFRFDNSPEPGGIWLMGAGLAAVIVGSIRRRRRS